MVAKKPKLDAKRTVEGTEPMMVTVSLGATIPVGEFQYLRPSVEIRNLRVDQPIEPQVEAAIRAARVAWVAIDSEIEIQITEMVSGSAGQATMRDTMDGINAWINDVAKKSFTNISKEVRRQKLALTELAEKETQDATKS